MVDTYKIIGSLPDKYPLDEVWLLEVGACSYERAYDPAGRVRQQAAMLASGDRRRALANVRTPTLVMHGDADPLFRIKGGQATAAAIDGARFVVMPGVGHGSFPRQVWPTLIDNICELARMPAAAPS